VGAMGSVMFLNYLLLILYQTSIMREFGGNGMVVQSQCSICEQPHDQLALERKLGEFLSLV